MVVTWWIVAVLHSVKLQYKSFIVVIQVHIYDMNIDTNINGTKFVNSA